jgi:aminopeptidase N
MWQKLAICRGFGGWKITRFERTNVVMVTYLVAFVIADYESLDDMTSTNFGGETLVSRLAYWHCSYIVVADTS